MTKNTIETAETVVDTPHNRPQPPRNRWPWVFVGLAIALLVVSLALALTRNVTLQKRVAHAEQIADERAEEIRQMSRQCGIAARVSLETLSDPEEAAADDPAEEETPALDAGIDNSPPSKVQRW